MNKLTIIGNLTRDPELRTTTTGINVCSFTVAVNRRYTRKNAQDDGGQREADFFDVTAWRERGELCAKYLGKGKKVCVTGEVSLKQWTSETGRHYASLEVKADDIEFLSPRSETPDESPAPEYRSNDDGTRPEDGYPADPGTGYSVVDTDELPF